VLSKLAAPVVLLAFFCASMSAAQADDFRFYKTIRHSNDISFEGRTVDDIRDMRAVDGQGLKLGKIDGVLIAAGGKVENENKVAAIILDLRHKIAKDKTVLISVDDVTFDPTNRKQLIVKKTQDQLRAMHSWGDD
jgi:hypothetical protein